CTRNAGKSLRIYSERGHVGFASRFDDRWTLCRCVWHPTLVLRCRDLLYIDGNPWLLFLRGHGDGKQIEGGCRACHHRTFLNLIRFGIILSPSELKPGFMK